MTPDQRFANVWRKNIFLEMGLSVRNGTSWMRAGPKSIFVLTDLSNPSSFTSLFLLLRSVRAKTSLFFQWTLINELCGACPRSRPSLLWLCLCVGERHKSEVFFVFAGVASDLTIVRSMLVSTTYWKTGKRKKTLNAFKCTFCHRILNFML